MPLTKALGQSSHSSVQSMACAFLSKRLGSAERNYDIGDRELLAVKVAMEEWRHWLEGTRQPVQVLTDHKNLEIKFPSGLLVTVFQQI